MFGFLKRVFGRKLPDPVALVLLQSEPRVLTRGHVAQAVSRAMGAPFSEEAVTEEHFCYHRLHVDGFELTVASSPEPYIPKERDPSRDLRLADAISRHEAAILVDCWDAPEGRERTEATGLMGKIVAELSDETTLAVYCFHTQRLNVMDEKLLTMLRDGEAMEAMSGMTFDPIAGIASDDEAMEAAMAEARRRWPEFVAAFGGRASEDGCIVKGRFGEGDRVEHMWLTAEAADAAGVSGVLQSDPFGLPRPRKGDSVRVELEDISDWVFATDNGILGNFTAPIVERAQRG